jgi:transcriptional regulator with XRE-family HTH domain
MSKVIGEKIRQIRELKGYSQEYLAEKLGISQRAYSKIERSEIKIDWEKIQDIASIFEMEPLDIVSFDDSLIFNYCHQSGKIETINNYIPDQLITQYEARIKQLEDEVQFLRGIISKNNEK